MGRLLGGRRRTTSSGPARSPPEARCDGGIDPGHTDLLSWLRDHHAGGGHRTSRPEDAPPGPYSSTATNDVAGGPAQRSTSSTSTRCSAMNQTCSSWRRRTSPISRSFVPQSLSSSVALDRVAHLADDRLVRREQAADHLGHRLGTVGRAFDRGQLGGVARVAHGDAAQALDALGEQVDQLVLLLGVLVEQQVELVEGRAGDEPVLLLVERVQDQRVGEDLVQQLAARRRAPRSGGRSAGSAACRIAAARRGRWSAWGRASPAGRSQSARSRTDGWSWWPWDLLSGRCHPRPSHPSAAPHEPRRPFRARLRSRPAAPPRVPACRHRRP